jgi:8-oxo-dGTP pyrophosphatase MutT (NUDIX family)
MVHVQGAAKAVSGGAHGVVPHAWIMAWAGFRPGGGAQADLRWEAGVATEGSSVVVLNESNEVLLELREDARIWALPAGRLEPGETYEQAAIREVREETGYEIELERLVGDYWRPQFLPGGSKVRVYVGRVVGGDPSKHDWESLEVKWFPLGALPKGLFKFSREHIEDALANAGAPFEKEQRFSGLEAALLEAFLVFRCVRNLVLHRP